MLKSIDFSESIDLSVITYISASSQAIITTDIHLDVYYDIS